MQKALKTSLRLIMPEEAIQSITSSTAVIQERASNLTCATRAPLESKVEKEETIDQFTGG